MSPESFDTKSDKYRQKNRTIENICAKPFIKILANCFQLYINKLLYMCVHMFTKPLKGNQIKKEDVKLSLFVNDVMVYMDNPVPSKIRLLEPKSKLKKATRYKANIKRPNQNKPRNSLNFNLQATNN